MAQKVQVTLVDDIDGSEAVETVQFSLDGTAYEIDLSARNAAELRDDLARWVGAARKAGRGAVGRAPSRRSAAARSTAPDKAQTAHIRQWAREQGLKVSERGSIPASIRAQWEAAH